MSQTSEEIEGKLAAYVDGTLDEAGRAEIERHLAANPHHARLLKDLSVGRELLRDLPRETAPPEVLESIQTQLERRLLLDEPADEAVIATIRPNRWRSLRAVAAVVVLGGTLAAVIYSVLPSPKETGGDLVAALERAERREAERVASTGARDDAGGGVPGGTLSGTGGGAPVDASPIAGRETSLGAGGTALGPGLAASPTGDDGLAARGAGATPSGDADPVWLVSAGDPAMVSTALRSYLADNRIPFDALIEPATRERVIGESAGAVARVDPPSADVPAFGREKASGSVAATTLPTDASATGAVLANTGAPVEPSSVDESVFVVRKVSRAQMQAINELLQQAPVVAQAPAPAEGSTTATPEAQAPSSSATPLPQARQQFLVAVEQNAAPDVQRFYNDVARRRAGGETLSDGASKVETDRHQLPDGAGLIAAGETLVIRLNLPPEAKDRAAMLSKAAPPGGTETTASSELSLRATVGEDGDLALPGELPRVPAIGLTPAELEQRIAEQAAAVLGVAGGSRPTVSVRRALVSTDAEQPAPSPTDMSPTTQPQSVSSSEGVTDLVIVVRGAALNAGEPPPSRTSPGEPAPALPAPPATAPVTPPVTPPPPVPSLPSEPAPATAPSGAAG